MTVKETNIANWLNGLFLEQRGLVCYSISTYSTFVLLVHCPDFADSVDTDSNKIKGLT